jgi:hypothetical protein
VTWKVSFQYLAVGIDSQHSQDDAIFMRYVFYAEQVVVGR